MCKILDDIWSIENQYNTWLEVWRAAAFAQAHFRIFPAEHAQEIAKATIDPDRVLEIEKETHHDLNSALRAAGETISPDAAAFMHFGLTGSDVVDTALSLRMKRSASHMLEVALRLARRMKHDTKWEGSCQLLGRAIEEIRVGKLTGPTGGHATFPPEVEEYALRSLGLRPVAIATQVVPRDHHAAYAIALAATALLHGPAPGASAAVTVALENIPLWHERDISHSSAERIYIPELCTLVDEILHTEVVWGPVVQGWVSREE